ncbi:MAG TPA: CHAT domain-containing tetratricopeptide repeat protein [Bryobacteraceae bacterium]|nr:CHAT domain-containing tetratricopeptide repeat protein [Bryobacteraceae bacterium]
MSAGKPRRASAGQRLAGAVENGGIAGVLGRHRRLLRPAVVLRLVEQAREELRTSAQESLRLAETARALAQQTGAESAHALALRAKANALWFLNRNQPAVDLYGEAIAIFDRLGEETEVGRTLSSSIQPLIRLGEYARALEGAGRARGIFQKTGDELRLARLDLNVANILHRQDRFAEALEAYERTYQRLLPFKDAEGMGVALHNMAVCLIVLDDFPRALATYGKAREFCEAHGMRGLVVQADYNIAYLYYLRADYSRALEMLRAARQAAESTGDGYHRALCYMDQSELYLELNMNEEAAETAQEAFAGFQALGIGYESGKSLANLAIAQGRMGKTARSLELFSQARARLAAEGNPVWPSLLDLYQALVLFEGGRFAEAGRLGAEALEFFRAWKMTSKEVLCRLLLARVALRTGAPHEARSHCDAAMLLLKNLDAPHLRHQAYFLLGQVEEEEGNFAQARECYEAARAEAESVRSLLRGEELKIAFMKGKHEIYESLVRLWMNPLAGGPRPVEAFACLEQAKSRSLRDLVIAGPPANRREMESELGRQARNLKEELNWYYHRIELEQAGQEAPSSERVRHLEERAHSREKDLLALLREMPVAEAESAGMAQAAALPLEEIREALGPETVLVEYFRVGDGILAAVVSAERLEVVPLAPVRVVQELAQLLRFQFSKFRLGAAYLAACPDVLLRATESHLRRLYQELVAPMEGLLGGRHLVLAPHESLHQLPLHALFDGERYLIDRFTVSYAPSGGIYALCRKRRANAAGPALILGVPDPRAPFIEDEVRELAGSLPNARLLLGAEANRQALEQWGPRSRLVHIATHGRFREDRPMFSSIRLGDGYATLDDLYQLNLPVELAALSGCSTGLSVVASGDELLGLVRGLLHAGARSLLLTLWDVQDRSTAWFMNSFYRLLAERGDKAAALQGAMQELRERHPHPYYWAPFVLIGAP